jgi:DNA polymerase-3 subunit delta
VKAGKASIGRCVDQPDAKLRFYLFLGPDEAQSRGLGARLMGALSAVKFALSAADLKSNPAILADEAAALSLFGERRLIWIEPAGNDILEAVEALLAAPSIESPVAAIAGGLAKGSPLLKLAESSPLALAFTAYAPEGQDAARMVADIGRRVGLKIGPPVATRIADSCAGDQALAERELEKLALYVGASPHSPKELEHEALDAVGADSGEGDMFRLGDLALAGSLTELAETVARMPSDGSEVIPAVRSLQRRLLMLAPARARMERGERIDGVIASVGRALSWKNKSSVERMLRAWTAQELAAIAGRAAALERDLLFTDAPAREALEEELFAIARRADRAR